MSQIRNEQTKLLAGNLDRLSNAFGIIGVVTPVIAWRYEFPTAPPATAKSVAFSLVWFAAAVVLHLMARHLLRRLRA